ncbi:hypothetical protein NPIL_681811 [Nephila pilipes]|uniref:Granulins domain-containing protein n=1 Tax=Nephila pilipes TaxID=299642 RepID=A0A8X6U489_NEPPI|nr:hypothetical protein NPIL_681811 [Nephila pilipes]
MYILVTVVALLCSLFGIFSECEVGLCTPYQTCCPGHETGEWTCCDFPNAVCCSDMKHCCPEGQVCSPDSRTCYPKMLPTVRYSLQKRTGHEPVDECCPLKHLVRNCEGVRSCINMTCCRMKGENEFGCCDHLEATCCPDGLHCCPSGDKCLPIIKSAPFCMMENGRLRTSLHLRGSFPKFPDPVDDYH